jgi:hypothetical protein
MSRGYMKHSIGQTRNGVRVYVDLIKSQAAKQIAGQPQLLTLAKEMLGEISVSGTKLSIERDMGRQIGYSFIVPTTEKDTVIYARLLRDDLYTRFVKKGNPPSTNYLTMTLLQDGDNGYELSDVWIGRLNPPRPGSDNETAESKLYWSNHAFVLDSQPLQTRTVTKTCPY